MELELEIQELRIRAQKFDERLAEMERRLAAHGWQPIETAPRNGERILVSAGPARNPGGLDMVLASFSDTGVRHKGVAQAGWRTDAGWYMGAKYWRPLPEAPHEAFTAERN